MLRPVFNLLGFLVAALLIMAAVALSAARLLLPLMGDYRADIEARLEAQLHRPVSIEEMDVAWQGFGPTLQLRQVRMWDEAGSQELFSVNEVWLHLDLLGSLQQYSPVTSGISLVGMDLDLLRDTEGRISLRGYPLPKREFDLRVLLTLLQDIGKLSVLDTRLRWEDLSGRIPQLELPDIDLTLNGDRRHYRADLVATLPAAYGNRLLWSIAAEGDPAHPGDWQGKSFVQVEGARLAAWSSLIPQRPVDAWGRLDMKLWGRFTGLAFDELALDFNLQDGQFSGAAGTNAPPFTVANLRSRLLWQRETSGWTLAANDFELIQNEVIWPASRWRLARTSADNGATVWRSEAQYLDIGMLSRLLSLWSPLTPGPVQQWLLAAPEGRMSDLQFETQLRDGVVEQARLRADFQDLDTRPSGKAPGLQGWGGHIDGDLNGGTVSVQTTAGAVNVQHLFREPFLLQQASGEVHWQRLEDRLRLYSDHLQLANEDVAVQGKWQLDLPLAASLPAPYLDLYFDIERGQVAKTGRYLPAHIMNDKAVAWLDRGLVDGVITGGSVLFHGPLNHFPFDNEEGRFEVRADVEHAVLDYHEGWEPIEDLRARLSFTGAGMEIQGIEGRIGASRLSEIRAYTPNLRKNGPPLQITGIATGAMQEMLRFLNSSPIGDRYQALAKQFRFTGDTRLDLQLKVPLRTQHGDFHVNGELALKGNGVQAEQYELSLEALQGRLRFTESSIAARDLSARLWEAPVTINLDTLPAREGGYHRLQLSGALGLVAKVKQWQWPVAAFLKGAGNWQTEIRIHEPKAGKPPRVELELASDLKGIEVALPEPFTKARTVARPLVLQRSLSGDGEGVLTVRYGTDVQAMLALASLPAGGQRLVRGELHFGKGGAQLPIGNVFQLSGDLQRVSLADWQAVLPKGDGKDAVLPPMEIDLNVAELEVYRRLLREVGLRITKTGSVWACDFTGESAQGHLSLAQDSRGIEAVRMDLDHLRIETMPEGGGVHEDLKLDPATLPSLSIKTRHLQYDQRVLGSLELQTRRRQDGMQVEKLALLSADYEFTAQGQWVVSPAGKQVSRFELQLKNGNLGVLQDTFGYERAMETSHTNATMVANWPGSPLEFDLDRVEGNLDVAFGSGQLVKVNAPAGRVLSILSIHSLQRRLSLDFSDLFGKGFSFDEIRGHISFVDGDAYTNDLTVQGPAAQIVIAGRTGFVSRDYDQLVTVTPLVSSNIPLAGVLAGGPAVGAALFVAERLFGDRMNRLARYQYQVTGSWDDPILERISVGPIPLPGKTEKLQ